MPIQIGSPGGGAGAQWAQRATGINAGIRRYKSQLANQLQQAKQAAEQAQWQARFDAKQKQQMALLQGRIDKSLKQYEFEARINEAEAEAKLRRQTEEMVQEATTERTKLTQAGQTQRKTMELEAEEEQALRDELLEWDERITEELDTEYERERQARLDEQARTAAAAEETRALTKEKREGWEFDVERREQLRKEREAQTAKLMGPGRAKAELRMTTQFIKETPDTLFTPKYEKGEVSNWELDTDELDKIRKKFRSYPGLSDADIIEMEKQLLEAIKDAKSKLQVYRLVDGEWKYVPLNSTSK